jgi:hypothetical protein
MNASDLRFKHLFGHFAGLRPPCGLICSHLPILVSWAAAVQWRRASIYFAMYVQIASFPHAIANADFKHRQIWFTGVKCWFEINGLAGEYARRWIWDRKMKEVFDRVYSIIMRRAEELPMLSSVPANDSTEEDLRRKKEIGSLVEEIPLCGEYLFIKKYFAMLVAHKTIEAFVILWFVRALVLTITNV